jgi:drug/metabolite transporter (DMT)-like permease
MLTRLDLLLVLMVIIWGANFSVMKVALRDFPELAFNAIRLLLAATVFVLALLWDRRWTSRVRLTRADWQQLALLGFVGQFVYQWLFLSGLKRTSVANGSLIVGASPVAIAMLSSLLGHERVPAQRWVGIALAFFGLYLVVGHGTEWTMESRIGDVLVVASMLCWAIYSVAAQPILRVHPPLVVTGVSMCLGALLYAVVSVPAVWSVDWSSISVLSWWLMAASAVFSLSLSYLIWYTAVQRLGSTRTSVYSYLTPVIAMVVASVWLGETISSNQVTGAAAILAGLVVTRLAPSPVAR